MGYAQDAMVELHGDGMIDNTPPTRIAIRTRYSQIRSLNERLIELGRAPEEE